ncbi:DUF4244 domain-containing protein [Nonomuraea sp. NPDC049625]|uniref:DUF4244 domain-containing protein n=1 Tax=Nonomuraea sp. NPDC049625 TaxID=3155775 RepID=UPI00343E2DA1
MHSPATTPDAIKATPERSHTTSSNKTVGKFSLSRIHITRSAPSVLNTAAEATAQTAWPSGETSTKSLRESSTPLKSSASTQIGSSELAAAGLATRPAPTRANRWLHYATVNRERGMSTAEYAVGTIAACAFAALLFKVVSSPEVQEMLKALIDRALNTTTG